MKKIKNKNAFKLAILTILANGLVACTTKPSNMLPSNKPEDKLDRTIERLNNLSVEQNQTKKDTLHGWVIDADILNQIDFNSEVSTRDQLIEILRQREK